MERYIRNIPIWILLICINTLLSPIAGQISKTGNITTHIDSIISSMPDAVGGDEYQHPNASQLMKWEEIIDSILAEDFGASHTLALQLDYRITHFTDNSVSPGKEYYILENNPGGTNYWGTYIFNPSPDRSKLVIQSPHSIKDFNTGKQGFYIFKLTGSRAFFLNGTSRCNSSDTTLCDGTSSVCTGSSEAYRISDQAHANDGTFQKTTEIMLSEISDMIVIQTHGFEKKENDPDVIMSNGVQNDTPPTDYLSMLKTNLLLEDNSLTFKIAHNDLAWDRLLGTTNTQGRLINGSADPCDISAVGNSGRFLHLEQAKIKLRETQTDWDKMANAVAATFDEDELPVELISFSALADFDKVLLAWSTATELNNYGFEVERASIFHHTSTSLSMTIGVTPNVFSDMEDGVSEEMLLAEVWETIGFVEGHGNSNSPKDYEFTDSELPNSDKVSYRLKQIDLDGNYEYSKVVTVGREDLLSQPTEFTLEQNYPNPFNPVTTIKFGLPVKGLVDLSVYNILGEKVAQLMNSELNAGYHKIDFGSSNIASGLYLYRINVKGKYNAVRKMLLVK